MAADGIVAGVSSTGALFDGARVAAVALWVRAAVGSVKTDAAVELEGWRRAPTSEPPTVAAAVAAAISRSRCQPFDEAFDSGD